MQLCSTLEKKMNKESSLKVGSGSVTGMLTSPVNDNETAKIDNKTRQPPEFSAEQRHRPSHISTVYKNTQQSLS